MAKRKNHLHASPVVLSLGLLAVMGFALVLGLAQVKQSQTTRSNAQEVVENVAEESANSTSGDFKGACNLTVSAPQSAVGHTVVGESVASSCKTNVVKTVHKTWVHAKGTSWNSGNAVCTCQWKNGVIKSCTAVGNSVACKANVYQSDAVRAAPMLKGTHTYCTYGQVTWHLQSGASGTSGPRSSTCVPLKY